MSEDFTWSRVLAQLVAGRSMSQEAAAWSMSQMMEGDVTGAQFGAFAGALSAKGISADELLGLVRTMRWRSLKLQTPPGAIDTCGTGGDLSGSINISTISAIVAAGAGAVVVKHGNRSATSRCGSADVLEALGVKIDLTPDGVQECIDEVGLGFCFAPVFHPAMRHVGPYRREIGVPTVFNLLGPLTNPGGVARQTIGVSDPAVAPAIVSCLSALGAEHVLVFHGSPGLDEISISGPTHFWDLRGGDIKEFDFSPPRLHNLEELRGGDAALNARLALAVLDGESGAGREAVLLNSSAALIVAGLASDMQQGADMARTSIDSGMARSSLHKWVTLSQSLT